MLSSQRMAQLYFFIVFLILEKIKLQMLNRDHSNMTFFYAETI